MGKKNNLMRDLLNQYPDLTNTQLAVKYLEIAKDGRNQETLRKKFSKIRIDSGLVNPTSSSRTSAKTSSNASPLKGATNFSGSTQKENISWDEKENSANINIEVSDTIIKNIEEALLFSKVDLNVWEVERHIFNSWTTSAIDRDSGAWKQVNNIQVKIWFKKISVEEAEKENALEILLANYKPTFKPFKKSEIFQNDLFSRPSALLISLTDFHLDKRSLDGKTIFDKVALYEKTVDSLVQKAYASHYIDEIVFMASSDFMHTDSYFETTTKGTQQQSTVSWSEAYEIGFDLQARTIAKLKQFCNKLHVVHVPSNHARTKEYYMIHALEVMFKNDTDIIFNRNAESSKVYTYGQNFLGFHHGDTKSFNMLPNYFASKFKKEWGDCKHVEILTGDKHHKKEFKQGLTGNEVNGTRMYILPSMSGQDVWHKDSLYDLAIQASVARVYDKEKGFCTEFEERV